MSDKIHPTAVIASSAQIGSNVTVGPYTVVDDSAVIGDNTILDTHVVIGQDVKMGENNRVFAGAVIGRAPQILGFDDNTKIGGLQIGDNNIIREYVTVHPSMFPDANTIVGNGNLLMVNVHLGHA
jgi:UDP-N-acetylglucosamine acyltransferase